MAGLRERQKEDRKLRIIAAARELFATSGVDNVTIEAIADIAGLSSVTVHNYYGTKSGVLLGLVAQSDSELIETFARSLVGRCDDLVDLVLRYFSIICDHTLTHLNKVIWRQVISASIAGSDPRFGETYRELDDRLAQVLVSEIQSLQARGGVAPGVSAVDLGMVLFSLQNARFVEFIATESVEKEHVLSGLKRDLAAILAAGPAGRKVT